MPSSLRVVDDITFDTLASLPLQPNELGNALTSCQFEGDDGHYYIVGTCFIKPGVRCCSVGLFCPAASTRLPAPVVFYPTHASNPTATEAQQRLDCV